MGKVLVVIKITIFNIYLDYLKNLILKKLKIMEKTINFISEI